MGRIAGVCIKFAVPERTQKVRTVLLELFNNKNFGNLVIRGTIEKIGYDLEDGWNIPGPKKLFRVDLVKDSATPYLSAMDFIEKNLEQRLRQFTDNEKVLVKVTVYSREDIVFERSCDDFSNKPERALIFNEASSGKKSNASFTCKSSNYSTSSQSSKSSMSSKSGWGNPSPTNEQLPPITRDRSQRQFDDPLPQISTVSRDNIRFTLPVGAITVVTGDKKRGMRTKVRPFKELLQRVAETLYYNSVPPEGLELLDHENMLIQEEELLVAGASYFCYKKQESNKPLPIMD